MELGQQFHARCLAAALKFPTAAPKRKWLQRAWREFAYLGINVFRQGITGGKSSETPDTAVLEAFAAAYVEFLSTTTRAYRTFAASLYSEMSSTNSSPKKHTSSTHANSIDTNEPSVESGTVDPALVGSAVHAYWAGTTVYRNASRKVKAGTLSLHEAHTCIGDLHRYAVLHSRRKGRDAWAECVASYTLAVCSY